jgi:hypothetical protein
MNNISQRQTHITLTVVNQQIPTTGCRPPTPTPPPPSSTRGKAGRNHLNEEIAPLLPIGIGERYRQTISNLGHAAFLTDMNSPYKRKC